MLFWSWRAVNSTSGIACQIFGSDVYSLTNDFFPEFLRSWDQSTSSILRKIASVPTGWQRTPLRNWRMSARKHACCIERKDGGKKMSSIFLPPSSYPSPRTTAALSCVALGASIRDQARENRGQALIKKLRPSPGLRARLSRSTPGRRVISFNTLLREGRKRACEFSGRGPKAPVAKTP